MYNWVYILRCINHSLYTGSTNDPYRRFTQHCNGKGAKYTRAFKPLAMVACWQVIGDMGNALKVESAIKKLSKKQKENLLKNQKNISNILNLKMQINISNCIKL